MKHYNPFDFYENNEDTIDENTVFEETGVSYENIRNKVFENISKANPKRRKKTPFITLVAIIAIIASISTTAYAIGKFSDVFGYLFSGECENGLYSGGNVKIECTDDSINAEVLGISAGNQSEVYVAYKLTKKDNTAFDLPVDDLNNTKISFETTQIDVEDPQFGLFQNGYGAGWHSRCNLIDEKTMIVYACYDSSANIRGKEMKVEFNKLCFKYIEHTGEYVEDVSKETIEIIEECKPVNGSTSSDEYYTAIVNRINELDKGLDFTEDNRSKYHSVKRENGKEYICLVTSNYDEYLKVYYSKKQMLENKYNLKENQRLDVVFNDKLGMEEFCVITYGEMDITIKSSVDLNYRENSKKYTVDRKTAKDIIQRERADIKKSKIVVSPFSVQFQCAFKDISYSVSYYPADECDMDDSVNVLRMKDGTEYYLIWDGETMNDVGETGVAEIIGSYKISLTNDEDNIKMVAVDINNIKEIQIGDAIITL